jgi:hypothetical protein
MDRINKIIEWFKANVADSRPAIMVFYFYCGVVLMGTTYGAYKGFLSWLKWRRSRKQVRITNKNLEPIVNNSIDSGQLGMHILLSGIISGLVVATAPISIPIIVYTMRERNDDVEKKNEIERSQSMPINESNA